MNEKDPKDMTAREAFENAVKNIRALDEDIETYILAVKTKKHSGLSLCGQSNDITVLLASSALENKDLRPIIHMASDAIKHFELKYDAESSDKSAGITLTKEQLEQLLKKGGRA